jgi:hypothetical protein
MALSIITNALGSRGRAKVKGIEDMSGVLHATQSVVDTLTPPSGGRYIVTLKDAATASTDVYGKRIVITAKPLFDSSMTQAEVAEVLTGLVAHEIGHTLFDGVDVTDAIRAHNSHPAYFKLHNVLADHRLERRMRVRFPMIGPAFTTMLRWVAKFYDYKGRPALVAEPQMSPMDRFNFGLCAIRYPLGVRWSKDPLTRAERRRWRSWAEQYTEDDTLDLHLTGLDVAYGWLKDEATPEPEPEDEEDEPEIDEPEGFPGPEPDEDDDDDDDDEDEDGPEGWTDPDDDDDDEDEGDESEPNGESKDDDEDEDEDEGDEPEGSTKSEDDEPDDEPVSEQDGEDDESEDDGDDEDGDDGNGDDGESKPDGPVGDEKPDSTNDPDDDDELDWNEKDEAVDLHDKVQKDYGQDDLGDRIDKYDAQTKVNFGAFGTMTGQWHD